VSEYRAEMSEIIAFEPRLFTLSGPDCRLFRCIMFRRPSGTLKFIQPLYTRDKETVSKGRGKLESCYSNDPTFHQTNKARQKPESRSAEDWIPAFAGICEGTVGKPAVLPRLNPGPIFCRPCGAKKDLEFWGGAQRNSSREDDKRTLVVHIVGHGVNEFGLKKAARVERRDFVRLKPLELGNLV
jgi:hypothetical protein